jgi:hypothetical protein
MGDSVLKPLTESGLPPSLAQLQTVGDGQSNPGLGAGARGQAGAEDSSSAGAPQKDDNFNSIPEPMRGLLNKAKETVGQQSR